MMFPADQYVTLSLIGFQCFHQVFDIVSIDRVIDWDVEMFCKRNNGVERSFTGTGWERGQLPEEMVSGYGTLT